MKRKQVKHSKDTVEKALRLYNTGDSIKEAARKVRVSPNTVTYWIARQAGYKSAAEWRAAGQGPMAKKKKANGGLLPTKAAEKRIRSKKLVPTQFSCPHCGGPVEV